LRRSPRRKVGGRIRQFFDRWLWQALIIAVAVLFFVAAVAFGLLAAYRELVSIYHPPEAALLMALALLFLGLLIFGLLAQKGRPIRKLISPGRSLNPIEGGVRNAVAQIGPFPLVLIAFAGGVQAGRR
jgi:hypothetical protein